MLAPRTIGLCTSCNGRLARDQVGSICSPCRRTLIESSARREVSIARDRARIKSAFDSFGVYGVSDQLGITPRQALHALFSSMLLPPVSSRRRLLLGQLVDLRDVSHVDAAQALNISRWTVATYRQLLGIERAAALGPRPRGW
jgi:hypothetical protein